MLMLVYRNEGGLSILLGFYVCVCERADAYVGCRLFITKRITDFLFLNFVLLVSC